MKKIAVIGPESTGKTWLIAELSEHYDCPAVSEYARDYIDQLDRPYNKEDLLKIARGQLQAEDMVAGADVDYIFCDTDLRVIKIWSMYKYGDVHPWIDYQISQRKYHAYLLTDIDLAWKPDPQRENPTQKARQQLFDLYLAELQAAGVPFCVISGVDQERLKSAIDFIEGLA